MHEATKNNFDHGHQSRSVLVDAWGLCIVSFWDVVQTRVGKGNSYLVSRVSLLQPQFSKKLAQHRVIVNETLSPGALSFLIFRAKNKALFNIYSFLKQKIKSRNAKWRRQRKQPKKVDKNNFSSAGHFVCTSKFCTGFSTFYPRLKPSLFHCRCFGRLQCKTSRNFLVTRFMEEMLYVFLFTFFFFFTLPLIFTLMTATISPFFAAAIKFSCFSSNEIGLLCFCFSFISLDLALFCYPHQWRHKNYVERTENQPCATGKTLLTASR